MNYLRPLLVLSLTLLLAACESKTSAPVASPTARESSAPSASPTTENSPMAVSHTDEEWKKILTPEQYAVLRQKGTERAFTGKYDDFYEGGTYSCAACGQELFTSKTKFDAGCGWPAFYAAEAGDKVKLTHDYSFGMDRTEVTCARCGSHLGHLFSGETHKIDGVEKTVDRYCINSVSIKFTPTPKPPATAQSK